MKIQQTYEEDFGEEERFYTNKWFTRFRVAYNYYSRKHNKKGRTKFVKKFSKIVKKVYFKLNIRQTKNNMITTFHTRARRVLWTMTCGMIGLKGPRKSTPFAAQQLGRQSAKKILRTKARKIYLILKSPLTTNMRGCISNLSLRKKFSAIVDLLPRPHNGLRKKKLRRV